MIYLCYSATRQATFVLSNDVLVKFPDNITRGRRFLSSLCASAIMMTEDESRLAHHDPIGRSLTWTMKTQLSPRRKYSLGWFGTVVNDEAAI